MSYHRVKSRYDGKIAGLYDLEETIGKGHYAVVKVARHVFTGEKVAVKVIDKCKLDEVSQSHLFQEVRCMKLVQHPNVVRLYEVIDTQTKLYLVLELGDGGDLYDYIMKHDTGLSEQEASLYFAEIVNAISYCHQLHVVHRDLKPENVIFFNKSESVKLTDFGFSNLFIPGHKLDTSCGSLAYSAPEILLGDSYDAPAVDVWSLGVILYMLVCGKPPFQEANDSETLIRIMDCHYTVPPHLSPSCIDLLSGMLKREPQQRLSLDAIRQHSWLSSSPRIMTAPPTLPSVQSKKLTSKRSQLMTKTPLVNLGPLTDDDHSYIIQKMVDGKIAKRDEIIQSLERNAYNHISATYFLLAERRLRKRHPHNVMPEPKRRSSCVGSLTFREPESNGATSTSAGQSQQASVSPSTLVAASSSAATTAAAAKPSRSSAATARSLHRVRSARCSLIQEELREEDEDDESIENGLSIDEMKQSKSVNELLSDDETSGSVRDAVPSAPSTGSQSTPRPLQTVHSMPQLILNQISEEDENGDVDMGDVPYVPPEHAPVFSIAGAGIFGGKPRKSRKSAGALKGASAVEQPVANTVTTPASGRLLRSRAKQRDSTSAANALQELSSPGTAATGARTHSESRQWTNVVSQRRISCTSSDDEDDLSGSGGHSCLRHEPLRQHSLVQCGSDTEGPGDGSTVLWSLPCSTTNSLDRRMFQNSKKEVKSSAGRSIVGAVKKSVSVILGHLSAVGDVTAGKPRCIGTWSSCSDLSQAGAKLCCIDSRSVNLADRQRISGCQFARELRQNRSEREAQLGDTNTPRSSLPSRIIRVRSRDFDTLISKFTAVDHIALSRSDDKMDSDNR